MEAASTVFAIGYLIGMFVASSIYRKRCGLTEIEIKSGINWREFVFRNPIFFLWMFIKILYWPLPLLTWLITGCPGCPWRAMIRINGMQVRRIKWVGFGRTESTTDQPSWLSR